VAQLLQVLIYGVGQGSIYIVCGLGFMIIYSVTRVVNFSQGQFLMLGGMLSYAIYNAGASLPIAILVSVSITTLLGMTEYIGVVQPLIKRGVPRFTIILATFGAGIVIDGITLIVWGSDVRSYPYFSGHKGINLFEAIINPQALWIFGTTFVLCVILGLFFGRTVWGKAFTASAIDPRAASLMGINPERLGFIAFGMSAFAASLAGGVMTPLTSTSYAIGLPLSIKGFIAAIVGGLNKTEGVIVGGLAIGITEALVTAFISSGYKEITSLVILIVVLIFRPTGLWGLPEAGKV
jgi:branched-chain amino acid transport system permease protein